ncbi:MAG: hypothetical protein ABI548_10150 [Polyangiaceae bacterium]
MTYTSIPLSNAEAERSLAFEERIQNEQLKLTKAFLIDEEIRGVSDLAISPDDAALPLQELIQKHAFTGLRIARLYRPEHFDVPSNLASDFLEALLRPLAVELARLGFQNLPARRDDCEDDARMRDLIKEANEPGLGVFDRRVGGSPNWTDADCLAGDEVRLDAQQHAQGALGAAIVLLHAHGPTNKKWRDRLTQLEKIGARLVQEAFLPPERDAADLFERAQATVRGAFKLLGKKANQDLVNAYVGKLTALAGLSLPRKSDASHSGRVRKAIERGSRKQKP